MKEIFKQNNFLRYLCYFSSICLLISIAGLIADQRILTGSPIWLKPFKFSASVGLYALTLLWFLSLTETDRKLKRSSDISAILLGFELSVILVQAYRGKISHFNNYTIGDSILFALMGIAIAIVWLFLFSFLKHFYTLYRNTKNPFHLAVVLGILISFLFMPLGFLMTKPTPEQEMEVIRRGGNPIGMQMGSHTVGAPDDRPGIPVTGWSKEGGDLRIPHFVGIHAMQILPLFAIFLGMFLKLKDRNKTTIVALSAIAYLGISSFTLIQALNGTPLFR